MTLRALLPLAARAARRVLARAAPPFALVALVLLAGPRAAPDVPGERAQAAVAAARREVAWSALLLLVLPVAAHAAAGAGARWRGCERDWLGALPVPRAGVALAELAGALVAALALLGATAAAAERAGRGAGGARLVRGLAAPRAVLAGEDERVAWTVDGGALAGGDRLRLVLATAPGSGPSAPVALSLSRGGARARTEAVAFGRATVEAPLPAGGDGPLELALERRGPGCTVVLAPGALALVDGSAPARAASLGVLARAAPLAAAALALAAGLGAWMGSGVAAGLALALLLPALAAGRGAPWLPGSDLLLALAEAGDGLAPPPLALGPALLGAAAAVALGTALAARGLDRGEGA